MAWIVVPNRSPEHALIFGIILLPSYLLISVVPGTGIPLRAFVATAVLILLVSGIRFLTPWNDFYLPPRYDLLRFYLWLPPCVAFTVFLCRFLIQKRKLAALGQVTAARMKPWPIFGSLSLLVPVLGFGFGAVMVSVMSGHGGDSWGFGRFFAMAGVVLLSCAFGLGSAVVGLVRVEKLRFLALLGLVVNWGPILWMMKH